MGLSSKREGQSQDNFTTVVRNIFFFFKIFFSFTIFFFVLKCTETYAKESYGRLFLRGRGGEVCRSLSMTGLDFQYTGYIFHILE